jgi:hypothetical protein
VLAGAQVYAADPKHDTWGLAKDLGVREIFETQANWRGLISP